jgi:LexA DNA binding domain
MEARATKAPRVSERFSKSLARRRLRRNRVKVVPFCRRSRQRRSRCRCNQGNRRNCQAGLRSSPTASTIAVPSALVYADEGLAAHHARGDDVPMSPPPAPSFTPKQGQYLAFIYAYTRVLGRPPAEADLQRHFGVTPPSIHQMVLTLERAGLIRRRAGAARSIEVLVAPELLPVLR